MGKFKSALKTVAIGIGIALVITAVVVIGGIMVMQASAALGPVMGPIVLLKLLF